MTTFERVYKMVVGVSRVSPKLHPGIQYDGMAYSRAAASLLGVVSSSTPTGACLIDAAPLSSLLSSSCGEIAFKWSLDRCEEGLKSSSSSFSESKVTPVD